MKRIASFYLVGLLSTTLFAQPASVEPFRFASYMQKMDVLPDGNLFAVSKAGEFARFSTSTGVWDLQRPSLSGSDRLHYGFENVCFFNKDTGFISSSNSAGSILYTTNGADSWSELPLNQEGPADDAIALRDGRAWVTIAGSGIAYTSNFGKSWKKKKNPNVRERFWRIFFNVKGEGLIGSLWNQLWYTPDNCDTWINIQTPLNKLAYKKTFETSRPEFARVAHYDNLFFVIQENLCFYSRKDSIQWIPIPGIVDFATDPENSALFLLHKNGSILVWEQDKLQNLNQLPLSQIQSSICRNGTLYVNTSDSLFSFTKNGLKSANANVRYTDKLTSPEIVGYLPEAVVGRIGNKLYKKLSTSSTHLESDSGWVYWFEPPFSINNGSLSLYENNIRYFVSGKDSIYDYNHTTQKVTVGTSSETISHFAMWEVDKIRFDRIESGCFHFRNTTNFYERDGNSFVEVPGPSSGRKDVEFEDSPELIDAKAIDQLAREIILNLGSSPHIEDLDFSESDYITAKKELEKFRLYIESNKKRKKKPGFLLYENNLDFDRLTALVDSVRNLDSIQLRLALLSLHANEQFSTTSFNTSITLINLNNSILNLYYFSSAQTGFYNWWFVDIDGIKQLVFSRKIRDFIVENGPPRFITFRPKSELICDLVKWLYKN